MKLLPALLILLCGCLVAAEPEFPLTEDSKPQAGVAKGTIIKDKYVAGHDSLFPGTERDYQIYLPADFAKDGEKPAPFMVFQDGVIYQAPVVFDNLIAKKDIPPLVGIFIRPGVLPAAHENALPRFNRSHEYDSVTDAYSSFLIEEFLPALEKKHRFKLSTDGDHAAISGNSSGGICAFVAAWHRPDRFRRVFTGVGTYVGIHGADRLPVLLRKMEPKPLRVFLQSGTQDNNLYCGDWWMANQMMERSLAWAGYDVNHAWGEGGHNQKHASQVFPDAMRWLWRGWQADMTVKANAKGESRWKGYEVMGADSRWSDTSLGDGKSRYLDVTQDGLVKPTETANARCVNQKNEKYPEIPGTHGGSFTTLSPDQTQLYGLVRGMDSVFAVQITPEGNLVSPQTFYHLENPPGHEFTKDFTSGGMCVDADGRLYVATSAGIQVCDQAGRVNFIITAPEGVTDVCFGGPEMRDLYIACDTRIYKRPMTVKGVASAQRAPIKPAPPKL